MIHFLIAIAFYTHMHAHYCAMPCAQGGGAQPAVLRESQHPPSSHEESYSEIDAASTGSITQR